MADVRGPVFFTVLDVREVVIFLPGLVVLVVVGEDEGPDADADDDDVVTGSLCSPQLTLMMISLLPLPSSLLTARFTTYRLASVFFRTTGLS